MSALAPASPRRTHFIEIVEPQPEHCTKPLPPEGNVKLQNYRLLNENIRAYTPTGDIHTSPEKGKLVSKFDICATISPPRAKILELLKPEDPGRDALEAIIKPAPRRGLTRPLDEDTRRFLQRALLSPSPHLSMNPTPEPHHHPEFRSNEQSEFKSKEHSGFKSNEQCDFERNEQNESNNYEQTEFNFIVTDTDESVSAVNQSSSAQRSLADELKEAEEDEKSGRNIRRELLREFWKRGGGVKEAFERERMGRLALSVEEDEDYEDTGLSAAARRLDALLAESRDLHEELAGIQADIQDQSARAVRCTAAARALTDESRALRYLDDVVALLRGDVKAVLRTRGWPFVIGRREPGRNYVV